MQPYPGHEYINSKMIETITLMPKRVLRHKMGYVTLDKTNSETLSSQIC